MKNVSEIVKEKMWVHDDFMWDRSKFWDKEKWDKR